MSTSKRLPLNTSTGIQELQELTRWVKVLKPNELNLFDRLYTGKIVEKSSPMKIKNNVDENRFSTVIEILDSTGDEEERASRLIFLVKKLEDDIDQIQKNMEEFERGDDETAKRKHLVETKFLMIFDAILLIREGRDYGLIRTLEEGEIANELIERYCKWEYDKSISTKLPRFEKNRGGNLDRDNDGVDYSNVALFQQLCGKLPPAPIAHQILSFSLLDWQKRMFDKLKEGSNVICCAPTSSGKTMIALGFIYTYLKYRPKSLLVYVTPNNVLAMEVSAILNKYVPNQVSTLLDDRMDRKMDERVVVVTPTGAFTHRFIDEKIPGDSFLVVDEVHCIGNKEGVKMEWCLRKFSCIQTLILSATMTQNTIEKLKGCIRNSEPIHEINETTRFMIPQHIIPKLGVGVGVGVGEVCVGGDINLMPLNPVGSIILEDLSNENLDIPMTPRDILSLFVKIFKTFGMSLHGWLHPIRFFFVNKGKKPDVVETLEDIDERIVSGDGDGDEEGPLESGEIRRLSLDDFAAWQKALLDFLGGLDEKEKVQSIFDAYKMSLTDEGTAVCSLENAYKLVEKLKEEHMLQGLFFFPNICRAFKYATFIYKELVKKPSSSRAQRKDKEIEGKIELLKKQLASLEKVKLKKGADAKDLKEKKYQIRDMIAALEGSGSFVQSQHSLAENMITGEDFDLLVDLLKKWNSNINQSNPLAQMFLFGIGVLSGDMPYNLQILIRRLYVSNNIGILMVTEDCAYGINTPTKTVILSDGFSESQRRQMAGRAGRKGLVTSAWVVYFRLQNVEEAGQKLCDLKGNELVLYTNNKFPGEHKWITKITHETHPYVFSKDELESVVPFFLKTRNSFGHSAIMAPFVVDSVIKGTFGQTNRHICCILAVIAVSPFNRPFGVKEGWNYEFPANVKKLYEDNGFKGVVPNYLAYLWLTNQTSILSIDEIEELVEVSKHWTYLFMLLKSHFIGDEDKLYLQILDLITMSNIRTSTLI